MASFHQHEVPMVVKLTERRMVVSRGWGEEGDGTLVLNG